ncbi:S-layer homology domain-containing protein [Ornithinibacillus scapharcae]|uniref:S-layer homology domain-containing protein n=1 Tax=Ornithinibacillus scapharcae TaxID=1147159 RepID=UPI000225BB50|nr:S-layer homology domain-containing protein [Ornithinibacillus scapharcae]
MSKSKVSRKLFATTASAALVASAVVPAAVSAAEVKDLDSVAEYAKDAVKELVGSGVIQGDQNGNFNPTKNIDRASAAEILRKALDLSTEGTEDFTDVEQNDWFYKSVVATANEGIFEGNEKNQFLPKKNLTRQEAAKVIVAAYGFTGKKELSFDDSDKVAAWAKDAVETAVAVGIMNGKPGNKFAPTDNITRAEFAVMIKRAIDAQVTSVTKVDVTNEKTLVLTGTGLQNLKAEDLTLAGNVVKSIDASSTKATVVFENGFPLDTEQTLAVKIGEETKEFKFTFSLDEVKTVELDVKTYDDDTVGQLLTFKINGAATTADTEWLRQAGYSVNFVAVDESTNAAAADFFKGSPSTSSTGLLNDEVTVGKYTVEIQVVKDGKVVVSDKKTITVADLESTTTAIDAVQLTTAGGVVLNSTTLVTGEVADITRIIGDAAGKSDIALPVTAAEVTSSNPSVISVDGQELTANVAGTATITVKIGNVTKTLNLKVESAARTVAKVTPSESTVKVVDGVTRTIQVTAFDQYGDPISVGSADITEDIPENSSSVALVSADDLATAVNGKTTAGYTITGAEVGTGTILFKDTTGKIVGQIAVQVTDVNNIGSTKIEHTIATTPVSYAVGVGSSKDYQVSQFNTSGFYNDVVTLSATPAAGAYTVESADTNIATVAIDAGGEFFTVAGVKAGKTDIVVKDENGLVKHKFTVTVSADQTAITKVNFKAAAAVDYAGKTVDVNDVLDVRTDGSNNPIVYGIEHNVDTIAKVRLDATAPATGILYIDLDNTGANDNNDIVLGAVTAEVLSGATGTVSAGSIDILPGSYTTAATDKASILFRVLVDANGDGNYTVNEAVATTTLNVNVK